jgi:hypothetical protein
MSGSFFFRLLASLVPLKGEDLLKNIVAIKQGQFIDKVCQTFAIRSILGAITSRTGFFLKSFQKWREEILLKECRLIAMADLGYGVLDTAMVETAAYVLKKQV